jgi:lipid-A-disaccharide synthase-like uncharacterized protein
MLWMLVGAVGQVMFSLRFLLQWITSERAGRSVTPRSFWYFSIGGSALLLMYAIHQRDPIFIMGQMFGTIVYARNLVLIDREEGASA